MPLGPNSRSDGSIVGSELVSVMATPSAQTIGAGQTLSVVYCYYFKHSRSRTVEPGARMPTTTPVDLSDSALWRNGFPDDLFAELRREQPIFHHELTDGVAQTVKRDFWMTTKHRHAQRIHRDTDSFTAVDGPLIQPIGVMASIPTIIHMDPPDLTKRRRVMSHAFTPKAIAKLEEGIRRRAASMIDRLLAAGRGDWIEDVADVMPMSVIGDIIGIPDDDRPEVFDTFDRILQANSPGAQLT